MIRRLTMAVGKIRQGINSPWNLDRGRMRIALCAVLLGCSPTFFLTAQAQSEGPVMLRIVLPRVTLCRGAHLIEVKTELRNVGPSPVTIFPAGIAASVSFENLPSSLDEGFRSSQTNLDPFPAPRGKSLPSVTLDPGHSYRHDLKLPLDREFFTPGRYRVRISYSGLFGGTSQKVSPVAWVDSNEADFVISQTCRHSRPDGKPASVSVRSGVPRP